MYATERTERFLKSNKTWGNKRIIKQKIPQANRILDGTTQQKSEHTKDPDRSTECQPKQLAIRLSVEHYLWAAIPCALTSKAQSNW